MKLLQKIKKVQKTKNGVKYLPTLQESVPYYVKVDNDFEPITELVKVYDPVKEQIVEHDKEITFTQNQVNFMLRSGQQIELITPLVLKQIEEEKAVYAKAIKDAELRGFNKAKNSNKALLKNAEKELKEAKEAIAKLKS